MAARADRTGVDDRSEYERLHKLMEKKMAERPRFVEFGERDDCTVVSKDMFKVLAHGKYWTLWKGVEQLKDALDLVIYQQLLWDLKPRTVFEIGAYAGGSALWMADMLKSYGCNSHVYSLDIDLSHIHDEAKASKDITFIQGDVFQIEKSFTEKQLRDLPHPWLLVEDAHVNLIGVLEYFGKFYQPGDYIIVEDTNQEMNLLSGQGLFEELGYEQNGTAKLDVLKSFMKKHPKEYVVDQHYSDFFGYNATNNSNGFLKRV